MFQGGGWAYTPQDAKSRATGKLGSSAKAAGSYTFAKGPLSSDQTQNPTFWDANRVFILYCDGGSWSGDLTEPLVVDDDDGTNLFVRGKRNMDAVFAALLNNEGMASASEVLLSGESAGALASILHADYVKTLLPDTVTKYGVMPISGFFLNHVDETGVLTYGSEMRSVFEYQNSSSGVNAACLASKTMAATEMTATSETAPVAGQQQQQEEEQDVSDCIFANETLLHTGSPVFLLNSNLDSWQLGNIWVDSTACMTDTAAQFQACTDSQVF
jgi:hypothetical protein